MMQNRETIKGLIELAYSIEEADEILSREFTNVNEKYAYLKGMFSLSIVDASGEDIETDYKAALSAIVNHKWR